MSPIAKYNMSVKTHNTHLWISEQLQLGTPSASNVKTLDLLYNLRSNICPKLCLGLRSTPLSFFWTFLTTSCNNNCVLHIFFFLQNCNILNLLWDHVTDKLLKYNVLQIKQLRFKFQPMPGHNVWPSPPPPKKKSHSEWQALAIKSQEVILTRISGLLIKKFARYYLHTPDIAIKWLIIKYSDIFLVGILISLKNDYWGKKL